MRSSEYSSNVGMDFRLQPALNERSSKPVAIPSGRRKARTEPAVSAHAECPQSVVVRDPSVASAIA
jgi:hypothetical protein